MHRFNPTIAKILIVLWVALCYPWLLLVPLAGMAFDGGHTLEAYLFVGFVLTYPLSVLSAGLLVFLKKPAAALLPSANILGVLSGFLWKR